MKQRYEVIANELTQLFKDEIKRLGLVSSGKLYNSIKWTVTQTSTGYELKMESMDYFTYLDDKYSISENIYKSSRFFKIQDQITQIEIDNLITNI